MLDLPQYPGAQRFVVGAASSHALRRRDTLQKLHYYDGVHAFHTTRRYGMADQLSKAPAAPNEPWSLLQLPHSRVLPLFVVCRLLRG